MLPLLIAGGTLTIFSRYLNVMHLVHVISGCVCLAYCI